MVFDDVDKTLLCTEMCDNFKNGLQSFVYFALEPIYLSKSWWECAMNQIHLRMV